MEKRSRTGWGRGVVGDLDVTNSANPQFHVWEDFTGEFENNLVALRPIACQSLAGQTQLTEIKALKFLFFSEEYLLAAMVSHTEAKRHLKGTHLVCDEIVQKYIFYSAAPDSPPSCALRCSPWRPHQCPLLLLL